MERSMIMRQVQSLWRLILFVALTVHLIAAGVAAADEEKPAYGWKNGFLGGFKLTQAGFSNWAAGGENSLAWQVTSTSRFLYDQEAYDWNSFVKVGYGTAKVGEEDSRKSVDEIKLESVVTTKIGDILGVYAAGYAETQFTKGYEYSDIGRTAVSDFMDPGYFTESIGMSAAFREVVVTRVGFAAKQTFTNNFPSYSDDPDTPEVKNLRAEYGAEWVTDMEYGLSETLMYITRLNLFSNLEGANQVDVKWDHTVAASVAPYVDVTFDVNFLYDRDISTKSQIREALAIGLIFKLGTDVD
jgi:hypothetical protein